MSTSGKIHKKIALRLVFLGFLSFLTFSSKATNYYISNTGNDINLGTSETLPWKTLEKLNTIVFKAGDQIFFKKGDIFYGTFTIKQSGLSGNPIIIGAYGTGDAPVISGFTKVSSWTNKGNNIWESTNPVSSLPSCNMLTINNINTAMGRYPKLNAANSGYLTFQSHDLYTSITSSELSASPNWTGAEVVIRSNAYKIDRSTITSHSGGTLRYASILNNPQDNSGFFIQSDIRCCTSQNDWFFNASTKKISIYSTSQPAEVNIASIERLVELQGSYITFKDLSFVGANGAAIYASDGSYSNINVNNCSFKNIGVSGIYSRINYLTVENCSFLDINNNSISVDYGYNNIAIRNNKFQNIGILTGMKDLRKYPLANSNVEIAEVNNLTFENNIVTNVGYVGVWFYGKNVLVKNNFFENFCAILNDGGAIYTYTGERTPMSNVLLTGNICINSQNTGNGTSYPLTSPGIYLDYASANVEISYNSIANTYKNGLYISSGGNVNIHHNTIFNASEYQLFYMIDNDQTLSTTDQVKNNTLVAKVKNPVDEEGNYWGYQKSIVYVAYTPDPTGDIKKAANNLDYNCYARPIADDKVVFIDIAGDWDGKFRTLAEWKSYSGQDAHSYGSPQSITNVNDLQFEYNASQTTKTITLSQPMMDMKGNVYKGSITLEPYTSAVLMKVNVSNPSTETNITAYSIPGQVGSSVINSALRTINVTMPFGTNLSSLIASFTLSAGASANIGTIAQISGTTPNDFTKSIAYTVTAQDNKTKSDWTVTVSAALNTQSNISSFSIPGQTGNAVINATARSISVTMPSATSLTNLVATFGLSAGATAKIGTVAQTSGATANNFTNPVVYTITAQDGKTTANWTVSVSAALNTQTNISSFSVPGQTGNAVINSTARTIAITMPSGTFLTSLVATFALSTGATAKVGSAAQTSGTTANNFTNPLVYTITAQDGKTTANWTVTVSAALNTQTNISSFSIPGQTGNAVINSTARTITINMPSGTPVTNLVATFGMSTGATAKVGAVAQTSGTSANNFTNSLVYTITAQDGKTTANWTVTVVVTPNSPPGLSLFTLPGQSGSSVINSTAHTVSINMPYGTSIINLAATFVMTNGATAKVGTINQTSGTSVNNFTSPVVYTLTSQDGKSSVNWTVTVTILPEGQRTQVINLKAGWNSISFNIIPSNTDFTAIFEPLITSGNLIKVQDEKGNFMVNTEYGWYNSLGALDSKEGYNVKVNSDAQLIVKGTPVATNTMIPLTEGFNIISYPLTKSFGTMYAVKSLIDEGSLLKVQDEAGNFVIKNGSTWFSNIDSLRPGKAYYVTVNKNTSINFSTLKSNGAIYSSSQNDGDTYFQKSFLGNPYFSMNFVFPNLSKSSLNLTTGDEIGIFDGTSCVGKFIYDGLKLVGASAGMEDTKASITGFNPGDSILFKVWKPAEQKLIDNITATFSSNSSRVFTPQGTAIVELGKNATSIDSKENLVLSVKNYPNPFIDYTLFEFKVSKSSKISLEIYDISGKKINVLTNQNFDPGDYSVKWDGTNQRGEKIPGLYMYYFNTGDNYFKSGKIVCSN